MMMTVDDRVHSAAAKAFHVCEAHRHARPRPLCCLAVVGSDGQQGVAGRQQRRSVFGWPAGCLADVMG